MNESKPPAKLAPPATAAARKRALGQLGERLAAQRAESRGYRVVERNFRCVYGEIDLAALDGATLVIVEVRTRLGGEAGAPEASIGPAKQARLRALAEHLRAERYPEIDLLRIDVCAVQFRADGVLSRVEWIEDAVIAS